jgi:hypothetical protein
VADGLLLEQLLVLLEFGLVASVSNSVLFLEELGWSGAEQEFTAGGRTYLSVAEVIYPPELARVDRLVHLVGSKGHRFVACLV